MFSESYRSHLINFSALKLNELLWVCAPCSTVFGRCILLEHPMLCWTEVIDLEVSVTSSLGSTSVAICI
jgi:hypothetical protein